MSTSRKLKRANMKKTKDKHVSAEFAFKKNRVDNMRPLLYLVLAIIIFMIAGLSIYVYKTI